MILIVEMEFYKFLQLHILLFLMWLFQFLFFPLEQPTLFFFQQFERFDFGCFFGFFDNTRCNSVAGTDCYICWISSSVRNIKSVEPAIFFVFCFTFLRFFIFLLFFFFVLLSSYYYSYVFITTSKNFISFGTN